MSLPPGFLDELRARLSIGQVVGRKVIWDQRKSNQAKGDLWAPCPFHQEKTASFHVDDRKGFYYCFGCHAKGDAISFVKETENVGFMEAVEILAGEAGMAMPARDPKAKEKADRRTQLAEVMEQAVRHYRLQLKTGTAGAARDYLAGRGLAEAALDRWEVGFAPDARQGLYRHLRDKGVAEDLIVDAGLAAKPDGGGDPYDRFRGRIVFPIRDARGRAIGLGGRAMDPNARAKYLNSPETELFDKGRSLYNHGPAREAAGKGQPLIVAEGYMDVIALAEAGFEAAVAPLGTAITEDQLGLLWRIAPEPVVALDGDQAGLRAAMRLIDLALPLLAPDKTLRFVLLPEGQDPDDLLRAKGAGAMERLVTEARPLLSLLWQRETEGRVLDSPERRAALDASLRRALGRIADRSVRDHYGAEIKRLRAELFAPPPRAQPGKGWGRSAPPARPAASTRASALALGAESEDLLREAVILAVLVRHSALVAEFEPELERMEVSTPEAEAVRAALLRSGGAPPEKIAEMTGAAPLEKLLATRHVAIQPGVRSRDGEAARLCLAEEFAKLTARRGARAEIEDAVRDFDDTADENLTWRVTQAAEAMDRAGRAASADRAEYDTGANGARLRRDEKSAFEALLKEIGIDGTAGE
ncbi:MAG: DNA primase [Paracoccaceae bacterium]|nr:DNA primase [Paracoccaceae bacterium]